MHDVSSSIVGGNRFTITKINTPTTDEIPRLELENKRYRIIGHYHSQLKSLQDGYYQCLEKCEFLYSMKCLDRLDPI